MTKTFILETYYYPPASKESREVANLTERKNLHTPFTRDYLIFLSNQNQNIFEKKFAELAARAGFVSPFCHKNS